MTVGGATVVIHQLVVTVGSGPRQDSICVSRLYVRARYWYMLSMLHTALVSIAFSYFKPNMQDFTFKEILLLGYVNF